MNESPKIQNRQKRKTSIGKSFFEESINLNDNSLEHTSKK